jgi:hypothetical protein
MKREEKSADDVGGVGFMLLTLVPVLLGRVVMCAALDGRIEVRVLNKVSGRESERNEKERHAGQSG